MGAACESCTPEKSKKKQINTDPVDRHVRSSRRRDVQVSDRSIQINPHAHQIHQAHHSVRSTFDLDDGVADMLTRIQIQTPTLPDSGLMFSPVSPTPPGAQLTPVQVTPGGPGLPGATFLDQNHSNTITADRAKSWDNRELKNLESEMEQEMQSLVRSQSLTGAHMLLQQQPAHGAVYSVSANTPGVAYFPDRHHVIMETVEMDTGPGAVAPSTHSLYSGKEVSPGFMSEGSDMDDMEIQEMRQQIRRLSNMSQHRAAGV